MIIFAIIGWLALGFAASCWGCWILNQRYPSLAQPFYTYWYFWVTALAGPLNFIAVALAVGVRP